MPMFTPKRGLSLAILIAFLVVIAYRVPKAAPPEPPNPALKVITCKVSRQSMTDSLTSIGQVQGVRQIKLSAGAPGRVESIEVPAGQWVKQGTRLLRLQPHAELKAAFDGVITDWQAEGGQYVPTGFNFAELIDTSSLLVRYQLPEAQASKLKLGQSIELRPPFSQEVYSGQVTYISPQIDSGSKSILLRAAIKDSKNLVPGQSLHVRHIIDIRPDVQVIPRAALRQSLEAHEIFHILDGKAVRLAVEVGTQSEEMVEIKTPLSEQEAIILVHPPQLRAGISVVPVAEELPQ